MRIWHLALCAALTTWAGEVVVGESDSRIEGSPTRQPSSVLSPPNETNLAFPGRDQKKGGAPAEQVERGEASGTTANPFDYGSIQGSGLPASPYVAGLSYMMSPQPFRVPITNRFYPCEALVRGCPYYPQGVYWGCWNRKFLPKNNLFNGEFRFNPYLSQLKAPTPTVAGGQDGKHGKCDVSQVLKQGSKQGFAEAAIRPTAPRNTAERPSEELRFGTRSSEVLATLPAARNNASEPSRGGPSPSRDVAAPATGTERDDGAAARRFRGYLSNREKASKRPSPVVP